MNKKISWPKRVKITTDSKPREENPREEDYDETEELWKEIKYSVREYWEDLFYMLGIKRKSK
ncbi:MAG: hypothetical protein LBJ18_03545 [Rickettsiales bacterium]|jgi:hypothetical protein|nr:hypothetical protein [Rickettsiales bacterium]